jgi:DNA polymerase III gamma/tau subunit
MTLAAARGESPDFPAVVRALNDLKRGDISPAYVAGLIDGVPSQDPGNVSALAARLRTLSRCRQFYYSGDRLLQQLAERPELINNGAIAHHIETLKRITADAPGREALTLLDDVQLLSQPAAQEIVSGRLPDKGLWVLYGAPGVGKSTLARIIHERADST